MADLIRGSLKQDDAPHGKDDRSDEQQNDGEFDDLPGKTQIAFITRQKVNAERYSDGDQPENQQQTQYQHG